MAEPRTGVFICNCGTNIAKVVDCDAVAEAASSMPGVVVSRSYKYMCSNPGQEMIAQDIADHELERVVVAACSPRMHEPTFRRAAETAGLNPYLVEMANIREQCSWVHDDGVAATEKAEDLVRAAVLRVARHEPLERLSVDMCPNTLVIGGGIAGHHGRTRAGRRGQARLPGRAPAGPRRQRRPRRSHGPVPGLGARHAHRPDHPGRRTPGHRRDGEQRAQAPGRLRRQLQGHDRRHGPDGAEEERQVDVGSVIVCTGYREFDAARATHLGYGKLPNVITSFEFERMLRPGRIETKEASCRSTSPSSTASAAAARSSTATALASAA